MAGSSDSEKKSETGFRNRKNLRHEVNLPVIVRVLIEEQTFTPYHLRGACRDINMAGALVEVEDLTRETYMLLIKKQRYIRLICGIPGREYPLMLFGRVVWYDYQSDCEDALCRMGIAFEPMKEETDKILREYIDTVMGQPSNAPQHSQ
jgi:hypothetical protein